MYKTHAILLLVFLVFSQMMSNTAPVAHAQISPHPNLFVSAENSVFQNHFAGAMVVEIIIKGNNVQTDQAQGEPNVNVNGRTLRMAQTSDGYWYAFFANTNAAKQADQASLSGTAGQNMDFGVFCSSSTPSSVLGADFSQTDGIAIPDSSGLAGTTQGLASFGVCSGTPKPPAVDQDNVVKNAPSLNTNSNIPPGQTGINPNIWPVIQLFSFTNDVNIEYDGATGTQSVDLTYSDIQNISINLDRSVYPAGSEVFATINDIQLNEDPTSVDSWTFNVNSPEATFYQAFPESGRGGTSGLVNLFPYLSSLGFKDNGKMEMNLGSVISLKTNSLQSSSSINANGVTYNKLVTFVETGPNTGVFESDYASVSTIGIAQNAPRSQSGAIEYNLRSASIVSGNTNTGLVLGTGQSQFGPGQREVITLTDNNQVLNSGIIETLNVFRSSAMVPTLKIGNPVTLTSASDVNFYSTPNTLSNPIPAPSSVTDSNSARLMIDTRSTASTNFYEMTLNLGVTAGTLKGLLIDTTQPNSGGTNWINYDLRSFQQQLGLNSFSTTSMTLHFGSASSSSSVQILRQGSVFSGNGLVQISNSAVSSIESQDSSSPVYLEINFGSSNGAISQEIDTQPMVFDLFSFGMQNGKTVNNAVYRAELQETAAGSGVFTGTIGYVVANQLNQFDPNFIKTLQTFGNNIVFFVNGQMVDQNGINFSTMGSSTAGRPTTVTSKNSLPTHTGTVTLDSENYRLGSPVTITVNDPDLASSPDAIQSFTTISDPTSPAADTVGDANGNILLEVWIKGFRYHQCTVNGVFHGGLAASGFTLTETSPGSGTFRGIFKMPSWICSEDGTSLISPVGGIVQAWYHDYMDASGRSVIIGSTVASQTPQSTSQSSTQPATSQSFASNMPVHASKITHMTQIGTEDGLPLLQNPKVGQAITFNDIISNGDYQHDQKISYIVQVKDSQGKVVYLKWIDDTIGASNESTEKLSWTPTSTGIYSAEIYVWNGMDSLVPLTVKNGYQFQVLPQ
ncbi:MAG: peptidase [Thaumarchaeota archaeon]|nr:peptidase [Nitrososphaerota archaeon]